MHVGWENRSHERRSTLHKMNTKRDSTLTLFTVQTDLRARVSDKMKIDKMLELELPYRLNQKALTFYSLQTERYHYASASNIHGNLSVITVRHSHPYL